MSVIHWRQEPPEETEAPRPPRLVVVCLPPPHADRLAGILRERLGVDAVAQAAFAPVPGADAYIVLPRDAEAAQAAAPPGRVGVLAGRRADVRVRAPGVAVLAGELPDAALDWLASLGAAPARAAEDAILWAAAQPAPRPAATAPWARGPVSLAVYSSGGGVGKTTTATMFAAIAAERAPTGLVELDEDRCGILTYFDRQPTAGLDSLGPADWASPERFGAAMDRVAVRVRPQLEVVPMLGTAAGLQCVDPDGEDADAMPRLFDWAAGRWAVTVYDLPARLRDPVVLGTLRRATRIVLVLEPTEITLDTALAHLRILEGLRDQGSQLIAKMAVLVNKVPRQRRGALSAARLAEALGLPLLGEVPLEPERYIAAINGHALPPDAPWRPAFDALRLPGFEPVAERARSQRRWSFLRRRS